jgi:hypothetical protein
MFVNEGTRSLNTAHFALVKPDAIGLTNLGASRSSALLSSSRASAGSSAVCGRPK